MLYFYISLIFITIFIYALLNTIVQYYFSNSHTSLLSSRYRNKKNYFYFFKHCIAWILVSLQQRRKKNAQKSQGCTTDDQRLEAMQDLHKFGEKSNDAIAFHGCDSKGNQLLLRFGRRHGGIAEFWLLMKLVDDAGHWAVYAHPEHPKGILTGAHEEQYAARGLKFEMVKPMSQWRVSYNGWMRRTATSDNALGNMATMVPVKFSFEWTAVSSPFYFNTDMSPWLLADALANETWSKQFFEDLKSGHEERYEQWGNLVGTVAVKNQETVALHLCGMRDHCFGERDWRKYNRYIANTGITDDGTFFHIGAVCMPDSLRHLVYGYVGQKCGPIIPVSSTSIDLDLLGGDGKPPDNYTISVQAGKNTYLIRFHVENRMSIFNGVNQESHSNLRFVKFELNNEKIGFGFSEFEYRNQIEVENLYDNGHIFRPTLKKEQLTTWELQTICFPLGHRIGLCREVVGGQLQELTLLYQIQEEFTVPKGAIIILGNAFHGHHQDTEQISKRLLDTVSTAITEEMQRQLGQSWIQMDFKITSYLSNNSALANFPYTTQEVSGAGEMVAAVVDLVAVYDPKNLIIFIQEQVKGSESGSVISNPDKVVIIYGNKGPSTTVDRTYDDKLLLAGPQNETAIYIAQQSIKVEHYFGSSRSLKWVMVDDFLCITEVAMATEEDADT